MVIKTGIYMIGRAEWMCDYLLGKVVCQEWTSDAALQIILMG